MSKVKWYKKEGDWHLDMNGEYVGMICPHKKYLQVLADGGHLTGADTDDLEDNKKWLEKWGRIEMKTAKYRESLWEKK